MFSLRSTICIFLVLFIPFGLRKAHLEPYPAVLFPEGAHVLRIKNGNTSFKYSEIYGLNKHNQWQRIDLATLMDPIPVKYFPFVFNTVYKKSYTPTRIQKIFTKLGIAKKRRSGENADIWFVNKLKQENLNPHFLRQVGYVKTVNIKTGVNSTKIANEQIVHLSE